MMRSSNTVSSILGIVMISMCVFTLPVCAQYYNQAGGFGDPAAAGSYYGFNSAAYQQQQQQQGTDSAAATTPGQSSYYNKDAESLGPAMYTASDGTVRYFPGAFLGGAVLGGLVVAPLIAARQQPQVVYVVPAQAAQPVAYVR